MPGFLFLLLPVLSCHPPDDTKDSDTGDTTPPVPEFIARLPGPATNTVLPFDVAIDPVRRRGFVTAIQTPTVSEWDLDKGEVTQGWTLGPGNVSLDHAQVTVDGNGIAWVAGGQQQPCARIDPIQNQVTSCLDQNDGCMRILGLPTGGAILACQGAPEQGGQLIRLNPDGSLAQRMAMAENPVGATLANGGKLVAVPVGSDKQDTLELVDAATLETLSTCDAPLAGFFLSQVQDGSFVLTSDTQIGTVHCDKREETLLTLGEENKEVFPIDDEVIILDRLVDDTVSAPNMGMARVFGPDLQLARPSFATGKNSGYGGYDPVGGLLWMNSEGSTEVWGMDPIDGSVVRKVKVGVSPEMIVLHPSLSPVVYVTGRLSGSVHRADLESGELLSTPTHLGWPMAPTFTDDGFLWIIDQLDNSIWKLDPDTLEGVDRYDLGVAINDLLVFDRMVWHPGRGTLFLTQAKVNRLLEWDPSSGSILHEWLLPGDRVTDPETIGILEIERADELLVVLNTATGVLTTIDPSLRDAVATLTLDAKVRLKVVPMGTKDLIYWSPDPPLLFVGGLAFDPLTWAPLPDENRDVTRVIGQIEDKFEIGWNSEDNVVTLKDPEGTTHAYVALEQVNFGEMSITWAPGFDERIIYLRPDVGEIRAVVLGR